MTERDVSLILRALGTVEGKMDGMEKKLGEVHDYAFRIDSKLNGEILARNAIAADVAKSKEEFAKSIAAHAASDASLAADVKKIKRWVIIAGVAGFVVIAAYAPEHIPKIIQGVIGIL